MGSLPSPLSSRGPLRHKPNLDENATTPLSFRGIIGLRSTEGDENCFPLVLLSVPNRGVIPTGAQRSGGTCCSSSAGTNLNGSTTFPLSSRAKPRDPRSSTPQTEF